jgi:hypothetical protein
MRTTLNQIRVHHPCRDGWEKLLRGLNKTASDDETLWIDQVLDHNGLDDALWCLRAVDGCDKEIRLYAIWCARRVQHLMTDPRSVAALDVAERYARGEASDEELSAAGEAAAMWSARWAAAEAMSAALAAARWAARWSAAAAAAAARNTERAAQAEELRRVCSEMREAKP